MLLLLLWMVPTLAEFVLQQPNIPVAHRHVDYSTQRGRRQTQQQQTLIGWHHIHVDASIEDPDSVFEQIRIAKKRKTAWSLGSSFFSFRRKLQQEDITSGNTNEEAFTGQEIQYDGLEQEEEANSTRTADGTVSSETEYNITENRNNDTLTIISTNNTVKGREYRPLRIKAFVSKEAGNAQFLNATEHDLLLNQILRPALLAWSAALRVPPVSRALTVDAQQLQNSQLCGPGPSVQVPPSHIAEGVVDVDMLLYVHLSFNDRNATEMCAGDYVAASSFCSTDQFDRPVAALLHLCIANDFFGPESIQSNIQSVMHEIGHALGFNAISLAHFRSPDGTPRTPRNATGAVPLQTVQCTGPYNITASVPLPSSEVLQFRTVRGGVRVAQVVTPSVRQVVRNHFDCQQLAGAELESGEYLPGSVSPMTTSCIGDHWERRLFQTDLMNPIIDEKVTFNPRFSTLTLAYFADSGWYQVDLSRASMASNWGRAAGCDFVEKDCIQDGQVPTRYQDSFCAQADDTDALEMRGCTVDLERKAFCSLGTFEGDLPPAYQYFNGSNLGGNDAFMDYCPVYTGFANGLCTDRSNDVLTRASRMERFGRRNSRCIAGQIAADKPQLIRFQNSESEGSGFSHSITYNFQTEQRAFCMPIACVVEDRSLRIQVDGYWEICREKDEVIIPRESTDVLSVVCPDPVRVCPTFYCTRDCLGSNKICNYTIGKCECESWQTSSSEEGPCVNVTARAPFYRPQNAKESGLPSPDDPLSDIYVARARNLKNEEHKFWSARNTSLVAAALFVAAAVITMFLPKARLLFCPQTPATPGDGTNGTTDTEAPSPDKLKLMASVVVDLRMNNTADLHRRMDALQNRESETDVSSETSFVSYQGTIADLSEQLDMPRSAVVVGDALAPPTTSSPRPVRRRGFFSSL